MGQALPPAPAHRPALLPARLLALRPQTTHRLPTLRWVKTPSLRLLLRPTRALTPTAPAPVAPAPARAAAPAAAQAPDRAAPAAVTPAALALAALARPAPAEALP